MTAAWRRGLATAAAVVWLQVVLLAPGHPNAVTWQALWLLPLELPALMLAMCALPRRARVPVAWSLGGVLAALTAAKVADLSAQLALARPFNWLLDGHLIAAAWVFLAGAAGIAAPIAAAGAMAALVLAVAWASARALRTVGAAADHLGRRRALAAALLVAVGYGSVAAVRWSTPMWPPVEAFTAKFAAQHAASAWRARRDLAQFRKAARADPIARIPDDRLFAHLRGRDMVLAFVESYGRTAVTDAAAGSRTRARLRGLAAAARTRGMAVRSAWLESPTVGGRSWLAHATLLSGVWIDTQARYRALMHSDRQALTHLLGRAGWRRVAVMPAITRAWPAGRYYGYDRLYDRAALDYAGPAFNWVTMPDQYSLAALARRELADPWDTPVFAEAALISSHAPFVPVPPVIAWDKVGDGRIYARWAENGPSPAALWRRPARVRAYHGRAVAYVLGVLRAFVSEKLPRNAVLIIVGDHQPAPLITGMGAGRQVPVHMVAPPAVLARVASWGWTEGAVPADDAPAWRMDGLRNRLVRAFSGHTAAPPLHDARAGP